MLQLLFSLRILAASIELTATALSALEGAYVACHLCLSGLVHAVMAKVTLAVLVTLALPALVYSHLLSSSSTMSTYRATPEGVSTWETFGAEVTAFCATLDDSNPCHDPVPFPKRAGGAVEIQVTACFTY